MPLALNTLSDREVVFLLREVRHFESGGLAECPLLAARWQQYMGGDFLHKVSLSDWVAQLRAQLNERAADYFMRACHAPLLMVEEGENGCLIVSRRGRRVTINPTSTHGPKRVPTPDDVQTVAKAVQDAGLFTKDEWGYDLVCEIMRIAEGRIP